MDLLGKLKKQLGLNFKPVQVFREHCAKLKKDRRVKKGARKVVKMIRKRDHARRRAKRNRRRRTTRRGSK